MIALIPISLLIIFGVASILESKAEVMNEEFTISTGPQNEDQKNRERIGLLKVAENYPKDHNSRKMLLEHIDQL